MAKYLIINADDFGLAPGVNQAIIDLHQAGVVTSTSLMVTMPGFKDAVKRVRHAPTLGVGLHFNLSEGVPIAPANWIPSLVDHKGEFSNNLGWDESDVMTELKAQMQRLQSAGINPTHIDSHGFIQKRMAVCRPMLILARTLNLPMRRTGWEPVARINSHPGVVDKFYSNVYFEGNGKSLLLDNLHSVPDGTSELICHPGYVDEHLPKVSTWTKVREIEGRVLADPEVLQTIRALKIRLINYSQVKYLSDFSDRRINVISTSKL
ncbi:MAG: ChbG/HpnK family deacetylase [Syntrophomonadaceae bacterium]|nr:ChbG/HpnK family deacetylase [Syntrophomonadaceae bacterium]